VTTNWCCRSQAMIEETKLLVKTKINITRNFWYDDKLGALQHV
jgi:hypothetical protein